MAAREGCPGNVSFDWVCCDEVKKWCEIRHIRSSRSPAATSRLVKRSKVPKLRGESSTHSGRRWCEHVQAYICPHHSARFEEGGEGTRSYPLSVTLGAKRDRSVRPVVFLPFSVQSQRASRRMLARVSRSSVFGVIDWTNQLSGAVGGRERRCRKGSPQNACRQRFAARAVRLVVPVFS